MTEHPDIEAMSAWLDGEASEWDGHLPACPACSPALARLEAASSAVARPVPPAPPELAEAAVARALAATFRDAAPGTEPRGAAGPGDVAPPRSEALVAPGRGRRSRPWASRGVWLGAGSAAAAVVVAAVLLTFGGRSRGHRGDLALAPPPTTAAAEARAPVDSAEFQGASLGEIRDEADLRARVGPALASGSPPAPMSAAARAGGEASGPAAEAPAAPPPAQTALGPPCAAEAAAVERGSRLLVYTAGARWRGTPAVVLGFVPANSPAASPGSPPPSPPRLPVRLHVMALDGCRLLASTSLT